MTKVINSLDIQIEASQKKVAIYAEVSELINARIAELELQRLTEQGLFGDQSERPIFKTSTRYNKYPTAIYTSETEARERNLSLLTY